MNWKLPNNKIVNINITKYIIDYNSEKGSSGEKAVRKFLKSHSSSHIWIEQFRLPRCLLRGDFMSPDLKVAIEIDGSFHDDFSKNKFFHNNSRVKYLNSIKRDVEKEKQLERNGFTVIRLKYDDLPSLSISWFIDEFGVYLA